MITKRLTVLICLILLVQLTGCIVPEEHRYRNPPEYTTDQPEPTKAPEKPTEPPKPTETKPPAKKTASELASEMTLEEKVAQLFLVKCPAGGAEKLLKEYPVGGIVLFGQDTADEIPATFREKMASYQSLAPHKLLIAVDEEGGIVNRVSIRKSFRDEPFPSVRSAYDRGGIEGVREQEGEKARFLRDLGINVNFGPVCDLVTRDDAFMASRSLRLPDSTTYDVVMAIVDEMDRHDVGSVLKHFPGYGNARGDTHTGAVIDDRTESQLWEKDLRPFKGGVKAGVGGVMVNHSIYSSIDPSAPACLSEKVVQILRRDLNFNGVIITDDITMGAVTDHYDVNEAAVQAILAGCDMILTGWSADQYRAVCNAVDQGRISEARLTESVVRILQWKIDLGLI